MRETTAPTIVDYPLYGITDKTSEVYELEALINSLKLWVASYRGDFIGGITRGGYVTEVLSSPMSTVEAELVYVAIQEGLDKDFTPRLEIINLDVSPNYEKRLWDIYLEAYSPELNIKVQVNQSIKDNN